MVTLARKLSALRKVVVGWERNKKIELKKELLDIEIEYDNISRIYPTSSFLVYLA